MTANAIEVSTLLGGGAAGGQGHGPSPVFARPALRMIDHLMQTVTAFEAAVEPFTVFHRHGHARARLTTTLPTKAANSGGQYTL
jgi:hypothetical protein